VSIVAGGTVVSQLVAVACSPIITRLYGPEPFGVLGVFVAIAGFLVPGVTLAYHIAVVLPASDGSARSLVRLASVVALVASLCLLWVVLILRNDIAGVFGFTSASSYLVLLPAVVFFSGLEQTYRQWLVRKLQFRSISGIAVAQAVASNSAMVACGLVTASGPMLLVVNTAGHALHAALLWLSARASLIRVKYQLGSATDRPGMSDLRKVAYTYRDFPMYRAPQVLINAGSQSLVPLLLAGFFGPVPAGLYALSRRVLGLPSGLVSQSVGTVLFPKLAAAAQRGESLRPLIVNSTAGLAVVGLFPFGAVALFGPMLFGLAFGSAWVAAGEYSRWLAFWLYFNFVSAPCIQALPILGLQRQFLVYEVFAVCIRGAAVVIGAVVFDSAGTAVALFSISGTALYVVLITWVLKRSGDATRVGLQ